MPSPFLKVVQKTKSNSDLKVSDRRLVIDNPLLRETVFVIAPAVLLFALYVQFHGELGPGGGFQAGIIFTVGIIFCCLIFGTEKMEKILPARVAEILSCAGVLLFAGTGFTTMLLGGNFLDYDFLSTEPLIGQHIGIFLVELGVGITIVGSVTGLYYRFRNF